VSPLLAADGALLVDISDQPERWVTGVREGILLGGRKNLPWVITLLGLLIEAFSLYEIVA